MSSVPQQLKEAYETKDWGAIVDILKIFGVEVEGEPIVETVEVLPNPPKGRGRPKTKSVEPTKSVTSHLFTENRNVVPHAPLAIPDRPNKFDPEDYGSVKGDTKKYKVPREAKYGKYAGKIFPSEDAFIKEFYHANARKTRKAAKKIKITCSKCGLTRELFESEIRMKLVGEGKEVYFCDNCAVGSK